MDTIQRNTIFTNVALTPDGDVWWEGMTRNPPPLLIDWTGQKWAPDCGRPAAHPNSRYTCPMAQCPIIDSEWENPNGVPISAIVFGARRRDTYPLVYEAFNWKHGVFWGSVLPVEEHEAMGATVAEHRDPLAMTNYTGINIGDHISHWYKIREFLGYSRYAPS